MELRVTVIVCKIIGGDGVFLYDRDGVVSCVNKGGDGVRLCNIEVNDIVVKEMEQRVTVS